MFSGYWLLADLDGTLISTPHKANGKYLPITASPCFTPIRDWLLQGGNVCIVTTADQRVIEQVYVPLRATLGEVEKKFGTSAPTREDYTQLGDFQGHSKRGCLLLSLYTGAVLYHCTSRSIATVPEYANSLHCATQEAIKLSTEFHVRERMLQAPVLVTPPQPVPKVHQEGSAATETTQSPSSQGTTAVVVSSVGESTASAFEHAAAEARVGHLPVVREECCVRGTCFDRDVCGRLKHRTRTLYEGLFNDVVTGTDEEVLEGMCDMSQRYKNMWMGILRFVDLLYQECITSSDNAQWDTAVTERGAAVLAKYLASLGASKRMSRKAFRTFLEERAARQTREEIVWKEQYFHTRRGVLTALGILRVEYVETELAYDAAAPGSTPVTPASSPSPPNPTSAAGGGSHAKHAGAQSKDNDQHSNTSRAEMADPEKAVIDRAVAVLLKDIPYAQGDAEVTVLAQYFATYMTKLLGTDPRSVAKEANAPNTPEELAEINDVAQVILLGVPLRLFSRYFKGYIPTIIRAGLQAMPQPNSAVFSKLGISKSTTLRYLLGKDRVLAQDASLSVASQVALSASSAGKKGGFGVSQFSSSVDPAHALSLGDNPHTTDYELTVFADVRFISVEKFAQRSERHARIQRRLIRAAGLEARHEQGFLPDGSRAPSLAQLRESTHHSGAMMDDRLANNIVHLGGEEDGTAMLLTDLIAYAKNRYGGSQQRPVSPVPVPVFAKVVPELVAKNRRKLLEGLTIPSKL